VISVVSTSDEGARDADSLALLRYGLRRYHRFAAVRKGQGFASVKLAHRDERAQLVAAQTVVRTARRDERIYTRTIDVPSELDGPLPPAPGSGRSRCAGASAPSRASR